MRQKWKKAAQNSLVGSIVCPAHHSVSTYKPQMHFWEPSGASRTLSNYNHTEWPLALLNGGLVDHMTSSPTHIQVG